MSIDCVEGNTFLEDTTFVGEAIDTMQFNCYNGDYIPFTIETSDYIGIENGE